MPRRYLGGIVLPDGAPENPVVGQVWIDPNDGPALKRWSGATWDLVGAGNDIAIRTPAGWGQGWRDALVDADTRLIRVKGIGDSIMAGYSAGSFEESYFQQVIAGLQAEYGDGGTGLITMSHSTPFVLPAMTPKVVATGSWFAFNQGYGGSMIMTVTAGDRLDIAGLRGRSIDIHYEDFASGGLIEVRINGTWVADINSNGTSNIKKATIAVPGGVADGYDLRLVSSTTGVAIHAVDAYNTTGVTGHNMAKPGATAASTLGGLLYSDDVSTIGGLISLTMVGSDLVLLSLGPNDYSTGTTAAAFSNSIRTAAHSLRSTSSPTFVVLAFGHDEATEAAQGYDYYEHVEEMSNTADIFDAAFLNLYARWPNYDSGKFASGLYTTGDAVHPNAIGHDRVSNALLGLLMAQTVGMLQNLRGPSGEVPDLPLDQLVLKDRTVAVDDAVPPPFFSGPSAHQITNIDYTPTTSTPDIDQVWAGNTLTSWRNEVGLFRGKPHAFYPGDAVFRAIARSDASSGTAFDLENAARDKLVWGIRYDGRTMRHGYPMSHVYALPQGSAIPADLPEGVVVMFYDPTPEA